MEERGLEHLLFTFMEHAWYQLGVFVLIGAVLVLVGFATDWQNTDIRALALVISIGFVGIMGILIEEGKE